MSYTPLDRSIITSTLLKEGPVVVACWALILASADKLGETDMQPSAVASLLRIPDEEADRAFAVLAAPDPRSRSQEFEGRRIAKLPDGKWQILNHGKYQAAASRAAASARQRKYEQNRKARENKLADTEWVCQAYGCVKSAAGVNETGKRVCSEHAFVNEGETE